MPLKPIKCMHYIHFQWLELKYLYVILFITALGLAHISKKQKHKFPHFCYD